MKLAQVYLPSPSEPAMPPKAPPLQAPTPPLPAQRAEASRAEKLAALRGRRPTNGNGSHSTPPPQALAVMPRQADNDAQLVELWLHSHSPDTQQAYQISYDRFRNYVRKPLAQVTLRDLQRWLDSMGDLSPASQTLRLRAIKSLMSFAHRLGYISFNVGAAIRPPAVKNTLAERILTEGDVHLMLATEPDPRNRTLLRLLHYSGIRAQEAAGLCWKDCKPRADGAGQINVFGKGGRTRTVLLPAEVWKDLVELRGDAASDTPVFRSVKTGKHLTPHAVWRIVVDAAVRAGIEGDNVSPHWLRHSHASHALDNGAPIHLVQATLGHANVATTSRYVHARPGESSAAYLKMVDPSATVDAPVFNGARIRETRIGRGIKLYQLAEQLGINYDYISAIERGIRRPNSKESQALARWLEGVGA